jgi:hypothetical protein
VAAVLAEVGARPEQVNDDAIRLEVPKQIRILKLVSEELQDLMNPLIFRWCHKRQQTWGFRAA